MTSAHAHLLSRDDGGHSRSSGPAKCGEVDPWQNIGEEAEVVREGGRKFPHFRKRAPANFRYLRWIGCDCRVTSAAEPPIQLPLTVVTGASPYVGYWLDRQAQLFPHLSHDSLLRSLTRLDPATRWGPPTASRDALGTPDQQEPIAVDKDTHNSCGAIWIDDGHPSMIPTPINASKERECAHNLRISRGREIDLADPNDLGDRLSCFQPVHVTWNLKESVSQNAVVKTLQPIPVIGDVEVLDHPGDSS